MTRRAARAATPPSAPAPTLAEIRAQVLAWLHAWDRYEQIEAEVLEKANTTRLTYALERESERVFLADATHHVCAPAFAILEDDGRSDASALEDLARYLLRAPDGTHYRLTVERLSPENESPVCRCGRPLLFPGDIDPWCQGCNMSASTCDCGDPSEASSVLASGRVRS
jgi:hypothetical protein